MILIHQPDSVSGQDAAGRLLQEMLSHYTVGRSIVMNQQLHQLLDAQLLPGQEHIVITPQPLGQPGLLNAYDLASAQALSRYPLCLACHTTSDDLAAMLTLVDHLYPGLIDYQPDHPDSISIPAIIDPTIWRLATRIQPGDTPVHQTFYHLRYDRVVDKV